MSRPGDLASHVAGHAARPRSTRVSLPLLQPLRLDRLAAKRLELDDPQPRLAGAGAADDASGAECNVIHRRTGLEPGIDPAGIGVEIVDRLVVPPATLIHLVA